ncbi:MAG: alpha/beta fold hydrolase [Anaerolineales bacterium]|nr:alpha/beta fold hydrolase [Anaerolineales bacterium]
MSTKTNNISFSDNNGQGALPIICLHSLAGQHAHWAGTMAALAPAQRVIAIDLPGHGGTPAASDYSLPALVNWLDETIAALGVAQFVLVGNSFGGTLAGAYAGQFPEKVAGLFLVDPSGDAGLIPEEQVAGLLAAMRAPGNEGFFRGYWEQLLAGATPDTREQVLADLAAMSTDVMAAYLEKLFTYRPLPALQRYSGPSHILYTACTDLPNGLHQLLPQVPASTIPGTSHWPQLDEPAAFELQLRAFLQNF